MITNSLKSYEVVQAVAWYMLLLFRESFVSLLL